MFWCIIVDSTPILYNALRPMIPSPETFGYAKNKADLLQFLDQNSPFMPAVIFIHERLGDAVESIITSVKSQLHSHDIVVIGDPSHHDFAVSSMLDHASDFIDASLPIDAFTSLIQSRLKQMVFSSHDNQNRYERQHGFIQNRLNDRKSQLLGAIYAKFPSATISPFQDTPLPSKPTILIVDDEHYFRKILSFELLSSFDVLSASNGQEAVDMVSHHPEIDVVLLDVRMPVLSGTDALPQIKAIRPAIEVVMVTAFRDTQIAIDSLKKGACDYLNKPFKSEEILRKVAAAVQLRRSPHIDTTDLSFAMRLHLFSELWFHAKQAEAAIDYAAIYLFFPETHPLEVDAKTHIFPHKTGLGPIAFIDVLRVQSNESESTQRQTILNTLLD